MTKYAVSTRAVYGPGGRAKAEEMAARLVAVYRTQAGYEHAYYMSLDDATGEFGSFVVFDTREAPFGWNCRLPVKQLACQGASPASPVPLG